MVALIVSSTGHLHRPSFHGGIHLTICGSVRRSRGTVYADPSTVRICATCESMLSATVDRLLQ